MIYAFDFDAECMAKKNGKVMNRNLAVVETVAVKECSSTKSLAEAVQRKGKGLSSAWDSSPEDKGECWRVFDKISISISSRDST